MPFKYNPFTSNLDQVEDISGTGDVTGPGSSTDNALARFDGTTGKTIQNSVAILDDAGALSGLTQLDVDNVRVNGNTISATSGTLTISNNSGLNLFAQSGQTTIATENVDATCTAGNYEINCVGGELVLTPQLSEIYGGTNQTTYSTGDTLYASASNTLSKLAAGSDGEVLTLASGIPSWAAAAGGGFDPNEPYWFDDFIVYQDSSSGIGVLNWVDNDSGSPQIAISNVDADHPGVVRLAGGSGIGTSLSSMYVSINRDCISFGGGQFTYKSLVKPPTLSDGSNTYKLWIGFYNVSNMSSIGTGIYFTYTDSESSGNWVSNTSNGSTNTTLDTSIAVTTDWTELGFVLNGAGSSVEFFIDGVSGGTISTNIPSSSDVTAPFFGINKTVGGTQRDFLVDAFYSKLVLTTPRFS